MMDGHDSFCILDGQTVVFIGDSITDCGRRAEHAPYGAGYVRFLVDLITARCPERRITFHDRGIGGDTVTGLQGRWEEDVLALKPDLVSILLGINDLHLHFKDDGARGIALGVYRETYRSVLDLTKSKGAADLVLMGSFYISTCNEGGSKEAKVLRRIGRYTEVVADMAAEFRASHIPLHEAFQRHLRQRPADVFCGEPVHSNPTGHMVIAEEWLRAVGW